MAHIIIPVNSFNLYGSRVSLDWIDYIIIRKWFNTRLLEITHITRYVLGWCFSVYVQWPFFLVVWGRMKLGVVFTYILFPRFPINEEVLLLAFILNPIKAHIYSLGYVLFYRFINDTWCFWVIYLHWSWVLWMSPFFQCVSYYLNLLGVDEWASQFCFCGRGHDRIAATTNTSPLCLVGELGSKWSLRKKCPPTIILAFNADKYNALLWMYNFIWLTQYWIVASLWVWQ